MTNIVTQKQLVDRIRDLANSHKLVNEVRYGFLTDVENLPDFNGPVVYIIPQPVSVPREGIFRFSFNLICMDELLTDKSNFEDIISDTNGILMDLFSALLYNTEDPESWCNPTSSLITPFQERFTAFMCGNSMTIAVDIFQSNCLDNKPFN